MLSHQQTQCWLQSVKDHLVQLDIIFIHYFKSITILFFIIPFPFYLFFIGLVSIPRADPHYPVINMEVQSYRMCWWQATGCTMVADVTATIYWKMKWMLMKSHGSCNMRPVVWLESGTGIMMSSHGNTFHITGHLWGESTGLRDAMTFMWYHRTGQDKLQVLMQSSSIIQWSIFFKMLKTNTTDLVHEVKEWDLFMRSKFSILPIAVLYCIYSACVIFHYLKVSW